MRRSLVVFLVFVTLFLLAVSATISALWKQLGWVTIPILLVALLVAAFVLKKLAVRAFEKALSTPFRMKGAALKNARVDVHELTTLSENEGRRQVRIDVTIIPDPASQSQFSAWDMSEISLVPHGTTNIEDYDSDEDGYDINRIEIFKDDEFHEHDDEAGYGPTRVRFEASVPLDARRMSFSYYFEVFGDLRIEMQRISSTA
jgi:uncharacterized membrane protein YccF (DUF307 family)